MWPKYWSFSISPSNEYSGLISLRMDRLDLLAVQGTLKRLLQHHSSKPSIIWHLAFFMVQLSHPYMTTGKNTALTTQTFFIHGDLANPRASGQTEINQKYSQSTDAEHFRAVWKPGITRESNTQDARIQRGASTNQSRPAAGRWHQRPVSASSKSSSSSCLCSGLSCPFSLGSPNTVSP